MEHKKLSEDVREGLSCLACVIIFFIIIGIFALLIRYWDKIDEENHRIYVEMAAKGDTCALCNNLEDAVKYYTEAFKKQEVDTLAVTLMNCEFALGNIDAGLKWLDKYADMTFRSDFVELRRTWVQFTKDGDTTKMVSSLDAIIKNPLKIEPVSGMRMLWDAFWNSDSNYRKKNNYSLYYFDYYAKLTALYYRLMFCKTPEEYLGMSEFIFTLVEDQEDDYVYIDEYTKLGGTSDIAYKLEEHERRIMNSSGPMSWLPMEEKTNMMKWWMFNTVLTYVHQINGYQAALDFANRITRNNTLNADSKYSYHKYFYGIYLGANDPAKFPTTLTPEELDTILAYSTDYNGVVPSANFIVLKGKKNFLKKYYSLDNLREEGDVLIEPIVLLEHKTNFGQWSWKAQNVPYLYKDSNAISYINNQFRASDSVISYEFFKCDTKQMPSTLYVLNLLQAEYSKQKGLSPYEAIVDLKKLIDENSIQ